MSHKVELSLAVTDNNTGIRTIKVQYEEDDVSFDKVLELENGLLDIVQARLEATKKKHGSSSPKTR